MLLLDQLFRRVALVRCVADADAQDVVHRTHGRVIDMNHTLLAHMASQSQSFAVIESQGFVALQCVNDLEAV